MQERSNDQIEIIAETTVLTNGGRSTDYYAKSIGDGKEYALNKIMYMKNSENRIPTLNDNFMLRENDINTNSYRKVISKLSIYELLSMCDLVGVVNN